VRDRDVIVMFPMLPPNYWLQALPLATVVIVY